MEWRKDCNTNIFICPELRNELIDVLKRPRIKKKLSEPVVSYIRFIELVAESVIIDRRFDRSPDIKDNYLFDLAYTVKSHYLVTSDYPLLNMKQVNKIRIISMEDWKELIEG